MLANLYTIPESGRAVMALPQASPTDNVGNAAMVLKECTKIHGSPPGERSLGKREKSRKGLVLLILLVKIIVYQLNLSRSSLDKYFCET